MGHTTTSPRQPRHSDRGLLQLGSLITIASPIASLLIVVICAVAGWAAMMPVLTTACAVSFMVGLLLTAKGLSRRAAERQPLVVG